MPEAPTRERLVTEAMRLFGEQAYQATSVAQIEAAADLAPGSGAAIGVTLAGERADAVHLPPVSQRTRVDFDPRHHRWPQPRRDLRNHACRRRATSSVCVATDATKPLGERSSRSRTASGTIA
jgi:Bacterial regulatory proteins, tetR family